MVEIGLSPKCQYRIGKFRVDFAFPRARLVVEADGKNYHKGWQKRRDKRRDAWLRRNAWDVLRFTGSEIYNAPYACAQEIKRAVSRNNV